jgi:hypothetical protein
MGTFDETQIVDYRSSLQTKENKLPFSVSACGKRTEVCCFRFLFAENKWKSPFSVLVPLSVYKNGLLKGQISEILIRFLNLYDMDRPSG